MAPPHVVAIPFPIPGHINPLLNVCKKLQAQGFKVTYVNSHDNHKALFNTREPVFKDGIQFIGISDSLPEREEGASPPSGMEGVRIVVMSTDGMESAMGQLVDSMFQTNNPATLIISDTFIHWTQDIANKYGIPRIAFSTTSATLDLVVQHMRRFRTDGFMPVNTRTTGDKLIDFISGMPPSSPLDIIPLAFFDEHPLIDFITKTYERMKEADWILSSTFQELEANALHILQENFGYKKYVPIGPFLPDAHLFPIKEKPLDRAGLSTDDVICLEWLDSRPASSVLYVAFGSIAMLSAEQFLELAAGLEDSKLDVLWVIRSTLVDQFPVDKFAEFTQRASNRFFFSSWAPQMHVLRHPAVGGFITHCGWNSTLESVCAGVPMIGWPCLSEQNLNCSFMVKDKLALGLKKRQDGFIERGVIVETVHSLMRGDDGKLTKKNVCAIGNGAKEAVKEGGSSYTNFTEFVKAMKNIQ